MVREEGMPSLRLHGSEDARALHAEAPAIDLHADPLIWTRMWGYDLNRRHRPPLPAGLLFGHTDVPRMLDGGLGGQFFGLVSFPHFDRNLEKVIHRQIDLLETAAAASEGRLRLARTAVDVERAAPGEALGALLGIEGAHALQGDLAALDRFAARGVRYLGLLHFSANECGAPAMGKGRDAHRSLTDFGRSVVARCEELGVLVDLAHINKRGFMDACSMATRPPIVSHTGVVGVKDTWRNIDDEQLRAVADLGGVIGVIFAPQYLGGLGIDAVADHLMHILDVVGEDAPALGSDWDGFILPTRGLEEASKLPNLTDALLARGLPRPVIRKILRDNALRVLRDVSVPS
ncbi:MAG: dipeptidase [Myxococcota bacterium]